VPLLDAGVVADLQRYLATLRPYRTKPLWPVTAQTVRNWLQQAQARAAGRGHRLPLRVTPHVLRHSFAMHCLFHDVDLPTLQAWLGHRSRRSTELYTQVFALDTYQRGSHIAFRLPVTQP
jgi:site-specific recombinase XerD